MLSQSGRGSVTFGGFMNSQAMRGLVTSVTRVSPTVSKIQVRLSFGLKYFPGQSIWISPLSERLIGGGLTGFYHLCGCPETALRTNQYEFLAETNPLLGLIRGLGIVKVGDFLKVEGPIGAFWPLSARPEQNLVWVASPAKLGPFLACVQSQNFQRIRPKNIVLLVEMHSEETFSFREIFESRGVKVVHWGKVSDLLKSDWVRLDFRNSRFFISTEKPLLRELWSLLINEKQVSNDQILHEEKVLNHARENSNMRIAPAALTFRD